MSDDISPVVDRRTLVALGGAAIAAGGIEPSAAAAAGAPPGADTGVEAPLTVTEGTNIAAAVSPDGSAVAFDLYGVLWVVDVEGGTARRLTDDLGDIAQPDWSPDGKTLAFQSYRSGNWQIWTIGRDGAGLKQGTSGPFDAREPRFSPDGRRIAFSSDRTGTYGIHGLDLGTGQVSVLADGPGDQAEPAWSPDGASLVFVTDRAKLERLDLGGERRTLVEVAAVASPLAPTEIRSPSFTPDGKAVVYTLLAGGTASLRTPDRVLVSGGDIFPFRTTWLSADEFVYVSDGKIRRRRVGSGEGRAIEFAAAVAFKTPKYPRRGRDLSSRAPQVVRGIGSPVLSPDGRRVVFRALNQLYLLEIGDPKPRPITDDRFHKSAPAWSPDGRSLAYSTDRGGKLDIWVRDLATGAERQLTRLPDAAVSGSWSRDGRAIAFLDQNGAVYAVEVATGVVRKIFGPLWEPGRPSWGPDGTTVALAAFKPYSSRYREGLSEVLTIDLATGAANYAPVAPDRSIGTRGDDGPVWSPDGTKIAFVLGSRLHVAPVDAKGRFTGPARALNDEVTDAPSWSGDSSTILYLSNGRLRLIPADGGTPRTVPLSLTYANARPTGRTVVRAGRLWDGRGKDVARDVDVLIEENRIVSVQPHGNRPPPQGARFIDASARTVLPGLMDIHTHREMQGYAYGDKMGRLWLAYGITTTRSPGGPAYHAIEERESIDAGARVGPRYYTTGEAIDGSRIFYNFMRPVTEEGQLALELQRAEALGYDLIKTYVRLPFDKQRQVIEWAHRRGLPVTSHYHYPSIRFGVDGMEHLGATHRLGYSRTLSPGGRGYQDVIALFSQAGARRTPTLFSASLTRYRDYPAFMADPRIKALFPAWEYAKLHERARPIPYEAEQLAIVAANVAQIRDTLRAGGRIVTGTDAPIDLPALSLHLNLRGMVQHGIEPWEALLTATRYTAEYLGAPLGVAAPGALADLIVVEGDPLARIEDLAQVRQVIKNGEVFTIEDLTAPFAAASLAERHDHVPALAAAPPPPENERFWWHDARYVEESRAACCTAPLGFGAFARAAEPRRFVAETV